MGKIKINLTSGIVLEKPLITCFQGNNSNYVVFDNEKNGSMGLPIICVSKINGNTLSKIIDQNEWTMVKENLKSIISGNKMVYLPVAESLSAPDEFFTQLTLPVASFDSLKNAYQLPQEEKVSQPSLPVDANINVQETQSADAVMTPSESAPSALPDVISISTPVIEPVSMPDTTNNNVSTVNDSIITPPVVENSNLNSSSNISELDEIKNAFMKSCENMFDALANKFQNK